MSIRIVRLGTRRAPAEGPRLGTVRRPPRGVPKARFAKDDWYDAWLPELAPGEALVKQGLRAKTAKDWRTFANRYRKEMSAPDKARLLDVLALLSRTTNFSAGCYCEDESRCHRSVLRELLSERGAKLAP
jgi:uncharacterized protein YeaO (DUF488 family)